MNRNKDSFVIHLNNRLANKLKRENYILKQATLIMEEIGVIKKNRLKVMRSVLQLSNYLEVRFIINLGNDYQ